MAGTQVELPLMDRAAVGRARGRRGEELAVQWLERCGYQILERNLRKRQVGEVDVLAQRGQVLHIVEVKCGRGGPEQLMERVDERKLRLLLRTAACAGYPREAAGQLRCQLDVLLVSLTAHGPRYQLVEDLCPPELQWPGQPDVG